MPVGSFALALVCVTWSGADVRPQYWKASGGKVVIETENTDKEDTSRSVGNKIYKLTSCEYKINNNTKSN